MTSVGRVALGANLLLAALTLGTGCEEEPISCMYGEERVLTLTPRKGMGVLDGEVTDLPAFPAPQGVPASEVDVFLDGVDIDDITTIRVTVVADGLGTISDTTYTPRSMDLACQSEGGLFVANLPVAYSTPVITVQDLLDVTGTLNFDVSGAASFNDSFPVELRITTYE